jgi:Polysaccharide pyruvyl transferase
MRALVAGWFSFEGMNTTAGDLFAKELACDWLSDAGRDFDVALAPAFGDGVDWRTVDPSRYDEVVFVCGPFRRNEITGRFLQRFEGRRLIGLNLSMLEPIEAWNPFDLLIERDSSAAARPDITFLWDRPLLPVVGVLLVHAQPQYQANAMHAAAHDAIRRLVAAQRVAAVPIDTRLEGNPMGLRDPAAIESVIARMDLVVTTRLHGMVLALKNGVPALAVDPVGGGAKIARQARAIGWPVRFTADALTDRMLSDAFDYCLTAEARAEARACRDRAKGLARQVRDQFLGSIASGRPGGG